MDGHRHHFEVRTGQQHHHPLHPGKMSEIFGVAGKFEAGLIEAFFVDRIGHHGGSLPAAGQIDGGLDGADHRSGIGGIGMTGN